MMRVETETEKIVAALHEVFEDSQPPQRWGFDELRREGFSEPVPAALECVTRRGGETYEEFIRRLSRDGGKFDGVRGGAYTRRMTTFVSAEGQIEIPEAFRKADALQPGQRLEIERVGRGEYRVRLAVENDQPKLRLIDVLRSCPVKGFFEPMERGDTTDDLKPLNFE